MNEVDKYDPAIRGQIEALEMKLGKPIVVDSVKSVFASKTEWINALTIIASVLTILTDKVPTQYVIYITIALAVVNMVLRFVNKKQVAF
jgi:hypothetical protein